MITPDAPTAQPGTFSLAVPPLFAALAPARSVLIAGAGGGFDVYAGLPLALALWHSGVQVHLASLSFSELELLDRGSWATERPSIVQGQIAAATRGAFGDVHATQRTSGSTLFVNPLMAIYFTVDLDKLAARCLYLDRIEHTYGRRQVITRIEAYRNEVSTRIPRAYPH